MSTAAPQQTPPPPLKQQIPATFSNTIVMALTTVSALTWADAIKSLFAKKGLFESSAIWGPWLTAIAATILAIFGTRLVYAVVNK